MGRPHTNYAKRAGKKQRHFGRTLKSLAGSRKKALERERRRERTDRAAEEDSWTTR